MLNKNNMKKNRLLNHKKSFTVPKMSGSTKRFLGPQLWTFTHQTEFNFNHIWWCWIGNVGGFQKYDRNVFVVAVDELGREYQVENIEVGGRYNSVDFTFKKTNGELPRQRKVHEFFKMGPQNLIKIKKDLIFAKPITDGYDTEERVVKKIHVFEDGIVVELGKTYIDLVESINKLRTERIVKEQSDNLVDTFIDKVVDMLSTLEESDSKGKKRPFITQQELEDLKNKLQTPEDMQNYLLEHKNEIEHCIKKCEQEGQSKLAKFLKSTLKFLWLVLKYGVPFAWRNKGTVLVLVLYFAICGKLDMSPWTSAGKLFDLTWETGKVVVNAAVKINNGVNSYLETSDSVGEKVGTAIGTTYQKISDTFHSLTRSKKK